jgi:hypothetical protein
MTISGWHDDYRNKDAGHDEMQAAIWRHCREGIGTSTIERMTHKLTKFRLEQVYVEFPLLHRKSEHDIGQIIGFADVALVFVEDLTEEEAASKRKAALKPAQWYAFFEVKPKIYSVGSVIRQCKALKNAASRSGNRACHVVPVVYRDDPSATLLYELHPSTWLWDKPASPS